MSGIEEQAFHFEGEDGAPIAAWRWSKPVVPPRDIAGRSRHGRTFAAI